MKKLIIVTSLILSSIAMAERTRGQFEEEKKLAQGLRSGQLVNSIRCRGLSEKFTLSRDKKTNQFEFVANFFKRQFVVDSLNCVTRGLLARCETTNNEFIVIKTESSSELSPMDGSVRTSINVRFSSPNSTQSQSVMTFAQENCEIL